MSTESDNRMLWDGGPGHYEVWYATFAHTRSGAGFWIRYTMEAPRDGQGAPYAQLWFCRSDGEDPSRTFGINKRFPIAEFKTQDTPFSVRVGDSEVRHDGMRGTLAGDGHEVSWDLSWNPGQRTHRHLPAAIYKTPGIDTKVRSPSLGLAADGEIVVDGERYEFDAVPGGQTHVWGRKHAYQWGWSHCNAFEGKGPDMENGAVFEGLSVSLKRGSVILPRLTLFTLYLDGEEFAFREFWKLPMARSNARTGSYHLIGIGPEARVETTFTCRPEDMIMVEYLDPDGDPAFNHFTAVADVRVEVRRRSPFVGRWRQHATLNARRTGHFEWGARAGDIVLVKKQHVAV